VLVTTSSEPRTKRRDLTKRSRNGEGAASGRPLLVLRVAASDTIPSGNQINVTEMLFVVSVSTSEVNRTSIGGVQSGWNVAVAVIV
jgi:hypothetical protein